MGGHYLIVAKYEGQNVYFNYHKAIEKGKELFLNISIEVINQRMGNV